MTGWTTSEYFKHNGQNCHLQGFYYPIFRPGSHSRLDGEPGRVFPIIQSLNGY